MFVDRKRIFEAFLNSEGEGLAKQLTDLLLNLMVNSFVDFTGGVDC